MNDRPNQDQARVEQGTIPQTNDTTDSAGTAANPRAATAAATASPAPGSYGTVDNDTGFLPDERMSSLRERWDDVQAAFVDDPQSAVQQAHGLVTELVDELVQTFTRERTSLEQQWSGGGTADTEQLRQALQRYRSFFNRLLGT